MQGDSAGAALQKDPWPAARSRVSAEAPCEPRRQGGKKSGGLLGRTWSYKDDLMPREGGREEAPRAWGRATGGQDGVVQEGLDGIVLQTTKNAKSNTCSLYQN